LRIKDDRDPEGGSLKMREEREEDKSDEVIVNPLHCAE
jgi:hypothetical protein